MNQDKNFSIRLKAAIDKRMSETGVLDLAIKGAKDYQYFSDIIDSFFASIDNISIEYLQGINPDNSHSQIECKQEKRW
jgi:hypothetical protein